MYMSGDVEMEIVNTDVMDLAGTPYHLESMKKPSFSFSKMKGNCSPSTQETSQNNEENIVLSKLDSLNLENTPDLSGPMQSWTPSQVEHWFQT